MFGFRRIRPTLTLCSGIACLLVGSTLTLPAGAVSASPTRAAGATTPDCHSAGSLDRAAFPRHPKIDNRFLPLKPGNNIVLSGTVLGDDGRLHSHEIRSTVSGVTKMLDGITTAVVFERDFQDGRLQESELAFEAQDKRGTVWNLGEYPEEYDNGVLVGADSTWIAGIAHARAGVNMLARPRVGTPSYLQGVAVSVGFRDCAKVARTGQHICDRGRCFGDVLMTDEWSPLDPESGHQTKYYAPGVGNIRVGAAGGTNQEVLSLSVLSKLSGTALARINAAVLTQDRRGYRVNPDVYGHTRRAGLGRGED